MDKKESDCWRPLLFAYQLHRQMIQSSQSCKTSPCLKVHRCLRHRKHHDKKKSKDERRKEKNIYSMRKKKAVEKSLAIEKRDDLIINNACENIFYLH
jgi:hypothetical protein